MSFNFFQTKLFKVIAVSSIAFFFIIINPYKIFNPVRSVFLVIFSPIQKVAYGLSFEIKQVKNFLSSIGQLKNENEKLIKENRELLSLKISLEEAGRENEILRRELKLLPMDKFNLEGASLVGKDPHGKGDWIEIDKGGKDGIGEEMPVVVGSGILIGKVSEVFPTTSKIVLLSNPGSAINAVDSKTGSKGVVRGEYGLGIIMDMVLQSEALNQGDDVITSGIGKEFPRGLLIGKVSAVNPSEDRLFQKAIISSPVDFNNLQFVFVVKKGI
ncbi:MAG: rod shape-determining protein MreC [Patescibacteria group bacterium]